MKKRFMMFIFILTASLLCGVKADAAVKTPKLAKRNVTMSAGSKYTIKVKNKYKKVSYKTSKKSVATVTKKGVVTAKKKGSATITVTVKYKTGKKIKTKKLKCKIKVTKKLTKTVTEEEEEVYTGEIPELEPTSMTLKEGETGTFKITGKYKKLSYSGYSKNYLRVDETKKTVTALKAGSQQISQQVYVKIGYIGKQGSMLYVTRICKITIEKKVVTTTPAPTATPVPTPDPEQSQPDLTKNFTVYQYIDPITKERKWPEWWLEFEEKVNNGTTGVKRYDKNGYECKWVLDKKEVCKRDPTQPLFTDDPLEGWECTFRTVDLIRPVVYDATDPFQYVGTEYGYPGTDKEEYIKSQIYFNNSLEAFLPSNRPTDNISWFFKSGNVSNLHSGETEKRLVTFVENNITITGDNNFSNSNVILDTGHYTRSIVFKGTHNLIGATLTDGKTSGMFSVVAQDTWAEDRAFKNGFDAPYTPDDNRGISIVGDYNGTGAALVEWNKGGVANGVAVLNNIIGNHNFSNFKGTNVYTEDGRRGVQRDGLYICTIEGDDNFDSFGW